LTGLSSGCHFDQTRFADGITEKLSFDEALALQPVDDAGHAGQCSA
jgi:hypothetical protein